MRALAATVNVAPEKAGFSCFDPTLGQRLLQAADQAEQPAELKLREAVFSEGPAGVANAVKNLWRNIGTYSSSLFGYVTGASTAAHTEGGEPITGRDLIALMATIGVDLGLLVLAILNPPPAASRRMAGAEKRQIQDAIGTVIKRTDDKTDMEWVRRHFIHHNKASYLVIPNLYSANATDPKEQQRALAMNQLAGVLTDLELVRWPEKGRRWRFEKDELTKLKIEEDQASSTDLTDIRKKWIDTKQSKNKDLVLSDEDKKFQEANPLRNHGLFSKAERALTLAGWSEGARRDIEIFRVVDVDGLTPLLEVLNEGVPKGPASSSGDTAAARDIIDITPKDSPRLLGNDKG